ncbi:MAG: NAD(P)-dependent oxidoreductase [Candidatus Omnitrophica bacterium]|nr:NAD(P)-dependent oxidoreductase [Candidatus Omnitrophota bacterium]
MKNVIVFGGSGFLGSHVADCLTSEGYDVTIYDIKDSAYLKKGQKLIKGDIRDAGKVEKAIAGKDIVYNFAGLANIDESAQEPLETIYTNIIGNANILEGCRKNKVERFIFASTIYVYSDLGLFYRSSKQACELIIENYNKKYGLNFTILRYGSLYGPRANDKNFVHGAIKEALEKAKITRSGSGEELREYIHVYDAAQLSIKILGEEFKNQYVILSGNQQIRVKDLLLMIKEILGNKIELEFADANYEEHYNMTPYNFSPKLAKKITDSAHVDLGQGILDLLNSMYIKSGVKA